MSKGQPIILQEKYYLDYFKYVLSFVQKLYPTIIGEQQQFIDEFYGLSEDAQCLYLRMNTRRGRFFRLSKLRYAEISDVASAKEELLRTGFCRHPSTDDALEEILRIFTKAEIIFLLEKFSSDSITKSSPRQKLVEQLLPLVDLPSINSLDQVLVQEKLKDVAMIKLLFFGHPYGDLSEFVARDVGHLKIPNLDQKSFAPFFQSREELETLWWIFEQYELFKIMEAADISPEELWGWLGKIFPSLLASRKIGGRLLEKFGMKLGQYFESKQWSEAAIVSYQLSTSTDAMTRLLRVLTKEKRWEEASGYALWLTENAKSAKLRILGQDFLKKQQSKQVLSTTDRMRSGILLPVLAQEGQRVETAVLQYFQGIGMDGFFSENYIWRSLFGLTFFDILQSLEEQVIHHPLQRLPSDFYTNFYENRKEVLTQAWAQHESKEDYQRYLKDKVASAAGYNHPFIYWHEQLSVHLDIFTRWLSLEQIRNVLMLIAQNPKENATGFPDLFVYNDESYQFCEVKSPNDHLSTQQLFWLNTFDSLGINAAIVRTQ